MIGWHNESFGMGKDLIQFFTFYEAGQNHPGIKCFSSKRSAVTGFMIGITYQNQFGVGFYIGISLDKIGKT